MKNILVMSPCPPAFQEKLERAAGDGCHFYYVSQDNISEKKTRQGDHTGDTAPYALKKLIHQANIIIGEPEIEELKNAGHLEWIQMTWAGTDIYTARSGFPEDVILTNASGAFGNIISEYVIGAILAQYRQFPLYFSQQSEGLWIPQKRERSLEGKRVLILGTGDIGSHVAKKLRPFETCNIGIRRNRNKPLDFNNDLNHIFDEIHGIADLEEELQLADIVVACLPNTPLTKGILDKERLHLMKEDAMLVNVGRGTLIDMEALTEILMDHPDFSAVLDVTAPEPLPADHPLWNLANVLITPHIAGPSFGFEVKTVEKIYSICAENLSLYMAGKPLKHVVDIKRCY